MINKMKQYDFIVFDCDGVILDSNELKSQAFAESVKHEDPILVEKLVTYHKENGGVSRYKKFDYFFHHIKEKNPHTQQDKDEALKQYARLVKKGMLECQYIEGVLDTVQILTRENIPLYVVSGSDEEELREIFKIRDISEYFESIFGSPQTKIENIEKIKSIRGNLNNGLVIGDSKSDMTAADFHKLDFIYIYEKSEWKEGKEIVKTKKFSQFKNFREII